MTRLEALGLDGNSIADVSPLSGLTRLEFLGLSDNSIADVSPLSGLTNLTGLWLDANNIADVSPLSGLTNLTALVLTANNIADVSPLAGLTRLEVLRLDNNSISDISPLVANTGLGSGDEVYLGNNPLSSTSINTHIPALESRGVTVHYEGGGDGGPVNIPDANLRAAIAAELGKAPNAPITPDEMATLTVLEARDQGIRDLTGLEFATNLELLDLGENHETRINSNDISNLSPLSGLTNLWWIGLSLNSISDLSPLASLNNLAVLYLWGNNISDLSPLASLNNLAELYIWGNSISDRLAAFELDQPGRAMWLSANSISDLSPLASLNNLAWLGLGGNSISDVSPLSGLTNLTGLYLGSDNQQIRTVNSQPPSHRLAFGLTKASRSVIISASVRP